MLPPRWLRAWSLIYLKQVKTILTKVLYPSLAPKASHQGCFADDSKTGKHYGTDPVQLLLLSAPTPQAPTPAPSTSLSGAPPLPSLPTGVLISRGRETKGVRESERQRKERRMRANPRERDLPRMESVLPSKGTENVWGSWIRWEEQEVEWVRKHRCPSEYTLRLLSCPTLRKEVFELDKGKITQL